MIIIRMPSIISNNEYTNSINNLIESITPNKSINFSSQLLNPLIITNSNSDEIMANNGNLNISGSFIDSGATFDDFTKLSTIRFQLHEGASITLMPGAVANMITSGANIEIETDIIFKQTTTESSALVISENILNAADESNIIDLQSPFTTVNFTEAAAGEIIAAGASLILQCTNFGARASLIVVKPCNNISHGPASTLLADTMQNADYSFNDNDINNLETPAPLIGEEQN